MIRTTVSDDYQIIKITITATPTILRELITDDLLDGEVIQIALTPESDILVQDNRIGTDITLAAGETKIIPSLKLLDTLTLTAVGTIDCSAELYYTLK